MTQELEEAKKLAERLRNIVNTYEMRNPLHTADFHGEDCACYRCAVDACDAAVNALPALIARVEALERIETAARNYFTLYCQDEAADDGPEMTGCGESQHQFAKMLGTALKEKPQ